MDELRNHQLMAALQEFRAARRQATLEQIWTGLTGKSADLLSYEAVREALGARETAQRRLQEIPIAAIVGSVGRYTDFTRSFLPRLEEYKQRWVRVWAQMSALEGLPPIEVYQLAAVYFVRDGNHRVSVARQLGFTQIEAYVTEVVTLTPFTPDDRLEDAIIKARYAHFLEATRLDKSAPDVDLTMSVAGNYRVLATEIKLRQQRLQQQTGTAVAYPDAALHWYREDYQPLVAFMRERGILSDFPDRTETDLYVWIAQHREEAAAQWGWTVNVETAVLDFADRKTATPKKMLHRLRRRLRQTLTPALLEAGPTAGQWRQSWLAIYREDRLFSQIMVAVDGQENGWRALQQAIYVAQRESGKILGLHVVVGDTPEAVRGAAAQAVRDEFERRCREANVLAEITMTTGRPAAAICDRAGWTDLVVAGLGPAGGVRPGDRLSPGFGELLRRCPRLVLAVPGSPLAPDSILLAYDGSPKAEEALFVATYLAGQWQAPLTMVAALGRSVTQQTADRARAYLRDHGVQARYIVASGAAVPLILRAADDHDCRLILMGGYGRHPLLELVWGSAVREVLRASRCPVLICR
jgi:nucleotide-binding universal stress UspA family protein